MNEVENIQERYKKRDNLSHRYIFLNPAFYKTEQEREKYFIKWIKECGIAPLDEKKLIEIGCGPGGNLLEFIRLGFNPRNIWANELIEERIQIARTNLSPYVTFIPGNAMDINMEDESFDIVFQSMVFSSILDTNFRVKLAEKMWRLVKKGGGVLWYDTIYNNPKNEDIRKVSYTEVTQLFPGSNITKWRITLAPPLSRIVTKVHPSIYEIFRLLPFLRTHVLLWIQKQ